MRIANLTIFAALLLSAAELHAQAVVPPADACGDRIELHTSISSDARRSLQRALEITSIPENSGLLRARSLRTTSCATRYTFLGRWGRSGSMGAWEHGSMGLAVQTLPIEASLVTNSAYPRSVNDGAASHGVGMNLGLAAGLRARWRFLEASLAPEFYYHENRDFEFVRNTIAGRADVANPYHSGIDYPSRFGLQSYNTASLGQSYLQASYRNISATFGTENLWIGAADVYPIVLSYTAPGFPHIRIGTQKPLDVKIARIEFQMLFASLSESDYFDTDPGNDSHYFGTTMLVIEPKFVRGLYLGALRAVHDTADATGHGLDFYLSRNIRTFFGSAAGGNLASDNAIGVILARWVHPASGFEAYAEWSREDTPGDWVDLLREPDWTQAYVLGVHKAFVSANRLTRLYAELIHLGESAPARAGRGFFSYYTHSPVTQGHTNEGQLLGAAIGPGSDAQLIGLDVFTGSGRSAFRIERTRYDDDTYYRTFARRWGETRHDAEINLSASRLQFVGPVELEGGVMLSRRYGRQFIPLPNEGADLVETNWSARFGVSWQPPF
ncbi:MAG: capsule assembly Wzi family protein [Gemmatimonadota bacterium]